MTSFNLFTGERALVTGSASNIGRGIAEALAREGAEVLLADIDPERNREAAGAIRSAGGLAEELTVALPERDGWRRVGGARGCADHQCEHPGGQCKTGRDRKQQGTGIPHRHHLDPSTKFNGRRLRPFGGWFQWADAGRAVSLLESVDPELLLQAR
jgi:hypothetical protein